MFATYLTTIALAAFVDVALPALPEHPKGVYMTSITAASDYGKELTADLKSAGGNMVVIDIQDGNARLSYASSVPISAELGMQGETFSDLSGLVRSLHLRGFYIVARFVAFKQPHLAQTKTAWALKDRSTGAPFTARDGLVWLDPSNPELIDYLLAVSLELADMGFDEIQYDYIRFPEAGARGYIGYAWQQSEKDRERVITEFVTTAAAALHEKGVKVGLDVFGVVAWNDGYDGKIIGQNIADLSRVVDAIYPMIYPSHFGDGFSGIKNPAGQPYYMVSESTKKFLALMRGGRAVVRPWLQGFVYRVPNYGTWYVEEQMKALEDLGIQEYVVWNAGNRYTESLPAFKKFK